MPSADRQRGVGPVGGWVMVLSITLTSWLTIGVAIRGFEWPSDEITYLLAMGWLLAGWFPVLVVAMRITLAAGRRNLRRYERADISTTEEWTAKRRRLRRQMALLTAVTLLYGGSAFVSIELESKRTWLRERIVIGVGRGSVHVGTGMLRPWSDVTRKPGLNVGATWSHGLHLLPRDPMGGSRLRRPRLNLDYATIPLWPLLLYGWAMWWGQRRLLAHDPRYCPNCRYPRAGLQSDQCPECGEPLPATE